MPSGLALRMDLSCHVELPLGRNERRTEACTPDHCANPTGCACATSDSIAVCPHFAGTHAAKPFTLVGRR
jgi:hypothetical protein